MRKTEVIISVDTEFSIGKAFEKPDTRTPIGLENVYCTADGNENGLPFITQTLSRFDLRSTFFIETAQRHFFGDAPMGRVVEDILKAEQDVQLHLHPCWNWFQDPDWKQRLTCEIPSDDCAELSCDALREHIECGIDAFECWGARRPVAFRAGSLRASRSIYDAMLAAGIRVGSNVGYAYAPAADARLHLRSGLHKVGDAIEAPVATFTHVRLGEFIRERLLTVTACSYANLKTVIERAHRLQISPVVILTHPFEFVKAAPAGRPGVRENKINKRRFEKLCAYLADNTDRFETIDFAMASERWNKKRIRPRQERELNVPLPQALMTLASNKINDLVPSL